MAVDDASMRDITLYLDLGLIDLTTFRTGLAGAGAGAGAEVGT